MGALLHLVGDAINNIGVMIAAAIMWKADSPKRFYADPTASLIISLMIFFSALPLGTSICLSHLFSRLDAPATLC